MRSLVISLVGIISLPLCADASVSKDDIYKLVENRISDELIIAFIRANGPVTELSSTDLIDLKKIGASDQVVLAILDSEPGRSSRPRPFHEPTEERIRLRDTVCADTACETGTPVVQYSRYQPEIRFRMPRIRASYNRRYRFRGHCR